MSSTISLPKTQDRLNCYTTILDGEMNLLPYFVTHYKKLGATHFPVLLYGDRTGETWQVAARIIYEAGGTPTLIEDHTSAIFSARHREATIADYHTPGEWAFFCDLDEFAQMTPSMVEAIIHNKKHTQFIPQADHTVSYVYGHWVDRLAPHGALVDPPSYLDKTRPPLESIYPMKAYTRPHLGYNNDVYVLSPQAPSLHHPSSCRYGVSTKKHAVFCAVHHFKWQTNVVDRLERRLRRIEAIGGRGKSWWNRVAKTLHWIKNHGGVPAHLLTRADEILGV